MPRQDVPYGGAICRLRERIAEIWDEVGKKLHSINGVEGDGQGNVQIVSGDSAVVISNDQVNHQIEIALDSSQLPAAAVSSVNEETGAVTLGAADIPSDGGSDVQADIDALKVADTGLNTAIGNEATARANADSTLQTNINAVSASLQGYVTLDTAQAISEIKTVPTASTGSRTQQIANGEKVQNDLDNYAPMARLANNQTFLGTNIFDILILNGLWNNKSTVCTSANNSTVFKRLYTMPNNSGSQYTTIVLLITSKRINANRAGILMIGNNRNASLTVHWLVKGDAVALSDFVATREGNVNTIWCRSFGTDADGYHAIKLTEHGTSDEAANRWTKITNDIGEVITSAGYTDSEGVTHTFDRYVEAS